MRNRPDVTDMLAPIDRMSSFLTVVDAFLESAADPEDGPAIVDAYMTVSTYLKDPTRPLITPEQARVFDRIRRPGTDAIRFPENGRTPDFLEPILVAIYARTAAALMSGKGAALLADLPKTLLNVRSGLSDLSDDLFGETLIEAELRVGRSPSFAREFSAIAQEVAGVRAYLESLGQGPIMLRRANNNGDGCSCVVVGCNGNGQCREFCLGFWDCVLVFIGIVLVIILG